MTALVVKIIKAAETAITNILSRKFDMKKNILISLIVLGVIVLVAGAAVGGFFGGKAYERNQANTVRTNFMRDRGIQAFNPNAAPNGSLVTGQNGTNFPGGGFSRGASGQIKSIDGNTLTLTSGDTETVITLSDTTQIVKTISGTTADLSAGQQVMVIGERDSNGKITTATQVTILEAGAVQVPAGSTP
jgi:hypothetical protein